MSDFFHADIGNVITWVAGGAGFLFLAGKTSQRLENNDEQSDRRYKSNKEKIEKIEKLLEVGNITALQSRVSSMEIQVATLQSENKQLTGLSTDMIWMKGTLLAVAQKLGVTAVPSGK